MFALGAIAARVLGAQAQLPTYLSVDRYTRQGLQVGYHGRSTVLLQTLIYIYIYVSQGFCCNLEGLPVLTALAAPEGQKRTILKSNSITSHPHAYQPWVRRVPYWSAHKLPSWKKWPIIKVTQNGSGQCSHHKVPGTAERRKIDS